MNDTDSISKKIIIIHLYTIEFYTFVHRDFPVRKVVSVTEHSQSQSTEGFIIRGRKNVSQSRWTILP